MKKNDLIKLLQDIDGNPEVVLWNGYVGDYMHVKGLAESDLVKQTFNHYAQMIEFEGKRDKNDFNYVLPTSEIEELKKDYRKYINWETNEYATLEDIRDKRYSKKRVVYIEAKLRGKSSYDRAGEMSY